MSSNSETIDSLKFGVYKNAQLSLNKKMSRPDIIENVSTQFIIKVAQSFENFKQFLRNDKINIDYTYLWDLVSMPNPKLFISGINLIILEIPEDDATNNIELVCPTNHYSEHMYDVKKPSLMLIKRENYFEPIFSYNRGKKLNVETSFSENTMPKNLQAVFDKIIKPTLGEKCRSFLSRPNEYRFKQAPVVDVLITELKTFVAAGSSYAAKIGETDDLVMAGLLATRMLMLLQTYHADLNAYLKDHTDNIIEPFPFIALMR
jgi:hypothetical protein